MRVAPEDDDEAAVGVPVGAVDTVGDVGGVDLDEVGDCGGLPDPDVLGAEVLVGEVLGPEDEPLVEGEVEPDIPPSGGVVPLDGVAVAEGEVPADGGVCPEGAAVPLDVDGPGEPGDVWVVSSDEEGVTGPVRELLGDAGGAWASLAATKAPTPVVTIAAATIPAVTGCTSAESPAAPLEAADPTREVVAAASPTDALAPAAASAVPGAAGGGAAASVA